jgi:hypothetical protein
MMRDFVGEALAEVIQLTDAADAENRGTGFVSFPPFTMDHVKGLTVKILKRSGKREREETVWLSGPFEIQSRTAIFTVTVPPFAAS